ATGGCGSYTGPQPRPGPRCHRCCRARNLFPSPDAARWPHPRSVARRRGRLAHAVRDQTAAERRRDGSLPPEEPHVGSLGGLSMFMRKAGTTVPKEDETIEAACLALGDRRPVFQDGRGTELHDLLTIKYENPVAGIVGGHLWILSQQEKGGTAAIV